MLLAGCDKKSEEMEIPGRGGPDETGSEGKEEVIKILEADPAKFHFVANWLSDSEIVFVEKENGFYYVNSFDLETGKTTILYEESTIIVDVLIHPSKNYILLHTTNNPTSATIKILSLDGTLLDEISIESSELAIEWNDLDPSLVLLTAFHQDWTFDVFLYNGKEEDFGLLDTEDPFPQWLGTDQIVVGHVTGHPLDGGDLLMYNLKTRKWGPSEMTEIVHFETFGKSILIVRITDQGNALYTIVGSDGVERFDWTMPTISNYSEWVFPEIAWVSEESVFLSSPEKGGQLDEIGPYQLIRVSAGKQDVFDIDIIPSLLRCSPSGQKCLTGYAAETIINAKTKEQTLWLSFPE